MGFLDILIITAHPDDAEISIGGTIAKAVNNGLKVGIADLTKGELGTRGTEKTRKEEAEESSRILGIKVRENLDVGDGKVRPTEENVKKAVSIIRKYRPKILMAPYFNDRHPDHIGAGLIAKEAMFYSGLPKYITDDNYEYYRPAKLLYFMMTYEFEPTFIVDISDTFETKMKAIKAFKTQFFNPELKGPETFISKPGFLNFLEAKAKYYGFKIRKDYGEPFYCEENIELKINSILDI